MNCKLGFDPYHGRCRRAPRTSVLPHYEPDTGQRVFREVRCAYCLETAVLEDLTAAPRGTVQGFYTHVHVACLRAAETA